MVEAGVCYLIGTGVEKDTDESRYWLLQAAEQNNRRAMRYLGELAIEEDDPDAAFEWFNRAAEKEDRVAEWLLGQMYNQGWGVEQD